MRVVKTFVKEEGYVRNGVAEANIFLDYLYYIDKLYSDCSFFGSTKESDVKI